MTNPVNNEGMFARDDARSAQRAAGTAHGDAGTAHTDQQMLHLAVEIVKKIGIGILGIGTLQFFLTIGIFVSDHYDTKQLKVDRDDMKPKVAAMWYGKDNVALRKSHERDLNRQETSPEMP